MSQAAIENQPTYNHNTSSHKYSYILHLSDFHFGLDKTNERAEHLLNLIDDAIDLSNDGHIRLTVITGDMVDSPSPVNFQMYEDFRKSLVKKPIGKTIEVFGNHDYYIKGARICGFGEKHPYLVADDNVEVIEDLKLIIIKVDSCAEESDIFAGGKIGFMQLVEIDKKLQSIPNLEDYYCIAMLHHHPVEVGLPEWDKQSLPERLFSEIIESTVDLEDRAAFMDWAKERNIKMVLHGHKHVPFVTKHENISIVACGSSTGDINHKHKGSTFIAFNLIKYDHELMRPVQCTTHFEENIGEGLKLANAVLLD